jgi:hypothetical protein
MSTKSLVTATCKATLKTGIAIQERPVRFLCQYPKWQVAKAIAIAQGYSQRIIDATSDRDFALMVSGDINAHLTRAAYPAHVLAAASEWLYNNGVMDDDTTAVTKDARWPDASVPKATLDMASVLPGPNGLTGGKPATLLGKLLGKIGITLGQPVSKNVRTKDNKAVPDAPDVASGEFKTVSA